MATKKKQKRNIAVPAVIICAVLLLVALAAVLVWNLNLPGDPQETGASGPEQQEESIFVPGSWGTSSVADPTIPPNPYQASDFAESDGYKTCLAGKSMHGIDVSYWQGDIDWEKVKQSGVEFVMIRLGWRGSKDGELSADENVYQNLQGASEAGLLIGGYFFSQAVNTQEAREEAAYALEILNGFPVDMPIVYDWEYLNEEARTAHVGARTLTDCTKAFCREIEEAGYEAMIYFNPAQAHKKMYLGELTDYRFWLAMYDSEMDYPYRVDMWQYSCTGSVPGIQGDVDLNLYFIYE